MTVSTSGTGKQQKLIENLLLSRVCRYVQHSRGNGNCVQQHQRRKLSHQDVSVGLIRHVCLAAAHLRVHRLLLPDASLAESGKTRLIRCFISFFFTIILTTT